MKKFNVKVNGKSYAVEVEEDVAGQGEFTYAKQVPVQQQSLASQQAPQQAPAPVQQAPSVSVSGELMTAPMPGTILDIKVTEGQTVKAGDLILILEAMKMENEIVSSKDGLVNKIHTSKSATVSTGDPLVTIG